jgi:flagellar biosynthesis/type III secretory pathway M-ring protein FliF/YscJ
MPQRNTILTFGVAGTAFLEAALGKVRWERQNHVFLFTPAWFYGLVAALIALMVFNAIKVSLLKRIPNSSP